MATYQISTTITGANGGTLQWKVVSSPAGCDLVVNTILTPNQSANITSNSYVSSVTIESNNNCGSAVIGLFVYDTSNTLCEEKFFTIDNNAADAFHFECSGSEQNCVFTLGAYDSNNTVHYATYQDCINCQSCPCNVTPIGCDTVRFNAYFQCIPNISGAGNLVICLAENGTNQPISITQVQLGNPLNISLFDTNNNSPLVFNTIGECNTVLVLDSLQIPPNLYYISLFISTDSCPMQEVQVIIENCNDNEWPPISNGACCAITTPFNLANNAPGVIYAQVIDLSSLNGDYSQDLYLDFHCYVQADKFEVYNGIPHVPSLYYPLTPALQSALIADTPYVGMPSASCNVPGCFLPARAGDTTPVVPGFWVGDNTLGKYHPVNNPGTTTGTPSTTEGLPYPILSPPFSLEFIYGVTYMPGAVGAGRLIIKGNTYSNPITIVAHGNNAQGGYTIPGSNPPSLCQQSATVWHYNLICPSCLEPCNININNFDLDCGTNSFEFDLDFTNDYTTNFPITITLTPTSGQNTLSSFSLLQNSYAKVEVVLPGTPATYYYPVQINPSNTAVAFTIPNNVDIENAVISLFYTTNTGSDVFIPVAGGSWTVTVIDSYGCSTQAFNQTQCLECNAELNSSYKASYCDGDAVNIVVTGSGFPCTIYGNHTVTGTLPAGITVSGNDADQIVISGTATGLTDNITTNLNIEVECGGCSDDIDISFTINKPNCNWSSTITPEACGSGDGQIVINATTCNASIPISYISVNGNDTINAFPTTITHSSLTAGTYQYTFKDANGCSWTNNYIVPTVGGPTITPIADMQVDCNDPAILSVDVTATGGTSPYTVEIFKPLNTLIGTKADAGPTIAVPTGDVIGGWVAGTYYIKVTDDNGCIGTTSFTITSTPAPNFNLYPAPSTCGASNGAIQVGNIVNASSPDTVTYYGNGINCGSLGTNIASASIISGLAAGTYTVCLKDNSTGCCTCKTATVANNGSSIAPPPANTYSVCEGSTVSLNAPCASGTTRWRTTSNQIVYLGNPFVVTPTANVTYIADCIDANNVCNSADVNHDITMLTGTTVSPLTASVCPSQSSPTLLADSLTSCTGGTIQWFFAGTPITVLTTFPWGTANPQAGLGLWISNVTSNAVLTYQCTNPSGCITNGTAGVILKTVPNVVTQSVTACIGQSVNLTSAVVSVDGQAYLPSGYTANFYNGLNCAGSPVSTTATATSLLSSKSVKITNPDGCSVCKNFSVVGSANPIVTLTANSPCSGQTLTLTSTPVIPGATYSWTKNGSPIAGSTATITIPNVDNTHNGTYQVTVTSGSCTGTASLAVTIQPQETITVPNVSACRNTGNQYLTISGSNNGLYTATYVSGPANILLGSGTTPSASIGYNTTSAPVGTYVYQICSTGACPACANVTITMNDVATPKLNIKCKVASWADIISDYNPANTYYWAHSNLSCSAPGWTQITNIFSLAATAPMIYIKVVGPTGCCKVASTIFVTDVPTLATHHIGCNSTGPTSQGLGNIILEINTVSLPNPYVISIVGNNLSNGDSYIIPPINVPANSSTTLLETIPSLSSGTWQFDLFITYQGITFTECQEGLEVVIACCPTCQNPTTSYVPANRLVSLASRSAVIATTPLNIAVPSSYAGSSPLANKISPSSEVRLRLYTNGTTPTLVHNSGWINLFASPGVLNTFDITGVLTPPVSGSTLFVYVLETKDSSGIYSSVAGQLVINSSNEVSEPGFSTIGHGGWNRLDESYVTYDLTMCSDNNSIETRLDGYWEITNMLTGQSTAVCDTTGGFGLIPFNVLITHQSHIRLKHTSDIACPSASGAVHVMNTFGIELFHDIFFYCGGV